MLNTNTIRILARFTMFIGLIHIQCKSTQPIIPYNSPSLAITQISSNTFIHTSYLETANYGKVASNGLIYMNTNEAIVIDTPINDRVAMELIKWIAEEKACDVTAVVATHFHEDCLGGLDAFHRLGIPSFGHQETIALAQSQEKTAPQIGFKDRMEISVGNSIVMNRFFGEAHTVDNIVSYIPNEDILFGGCAVKSLNAMKGNLEDANVADWSKTITNIETAYPNVKIVVPGHGPYGTIALLHYSKELFDEDK